MRSIRSDYGVSGITCRGPTHGSCLNRSDLKDEQRPRSHTLDHATNTAQNVSSCMGPGSGSLRATIVQDFVSIARSTKPGVLFTNLDPSTWTDCSYFAASASPKPLPQPSTQVPHSPDYPRQYQLVGKDSSAETQREQDTSGGGKANTYPSGRGFLFFPPRASPLRLNRPPHEVEVTLPRGRIPSRNQNPKPPKALHRHANTLNNRRMSVKKPNHRKRSMGTRTP